MGLGVQEGDHPPSSGVLEKPGRLLKPSSNVALFMYLTCNSYLGRPDSDFELNQSDSIFMTYNSL